MLNLIEQLDTNVKELLLCPNCAQPLSHPKILNCLHSFCLECLDNCLQANKINPGDYFLCPLCQSKNKLPENSGVSELKTNVFAHSLLTLRKFRSEQNIIEDKNCNQCDKLFRKKLNNNFKSYQLQKVNDEIWFCLECNCWLCGECFSNHEKVKTSKKHQIISNRNISSSIVHFNLLKEAKCLSFCNKHSERLISFCMSCDGELICNMCQMTLHNSHYFIDISKHAEIEKDRLSYLIAGTNIYIRDSSRLLSNLQNQLKNIDKHRKKFNNNFASHLINTIDAIISEFHSHSENLHKSIKDIHMNRLKYIKNQNIENLKNKLESAKIALIYAGNLLNYSYPATFIRSSEVVIKRLVVLQKSNLRKCHEEFIYSELNQLTNVKTGNEEINKINSNKFSNNEINDDNYESVINKWAIYSLGLTKPSSLRDLESLLGQVTFSSIKELQNDFCFHIFSAKLKNVDLKNCVISDMIFDCKGNLVIVDEANRNIKVFSRNGTIIKYTAQNLLSYPIRITYLTKRQQYLINDKNSLILLDKNSTSFIDYLPYSSWVDYSNNSTDITTTTKINDFVSYNNHYHDNDESLHYSNYASNNNTHKFTDDSVFELSSPSIILSSKFINDENEKISKVKTNIICNSLDIKKNSIEEKNKNLSELKTKNSSLEPFTIAQKLNQPVALLHTNQGEILISDWISGKIESFDSSGKSLRQFASRSHGPAYLSSNDARLDRMYAVSDILDGAVRIFSKNGSMVACFRGGPLNYDDDNCNINGECNNNNNNDKKFNNITENGDKTNEYNISDNGDNADYKKGYHVNANNNNNIIKNINNNLDENTNLKNSDNRIGNIINEIPTFEHEKRSHKNSEESKDKDRPGKLLLLSENPYLDHPHSSCWLDQNKLLICDTWNNRLIMIDCTGRYLRTVYDCKNGGLKWPQIVLYDKKDNLIFLAERGGVIKLFKYR